MMAALETMRKRSVQITFQTLVWVRSRWQVLILLLLGSVILVGFLSVYLPSGIDWHETFRPAAQAVLHFHSPYTVSGYLNPPWAILPLLPIALLPESIGRAVVLLGSLAAYSLVAYRLGAKALTLGAFLISPIVMHGLLNSSIDWMALMGFILPPQIGLFFVIIKPQVGFTVAIFWLVESWRKGGLREVLRVFWPVTAAFLASLVVFGLWPLRADVTLSYWWNASLWPLSIPVGLALMVASLRTRKAKYAMGAAPCLSPYVLFHSWVGSLAALAEAPAEMIAAVVGLWVLVIIRAIG